MNKIDPALPYFPAHLTITPEEYHAIKAFQRGMATEDQQRRAWQYITETLCGTYDLSYRPSQRDTDFAEGKRFVGLQMIKLSKILPEAVKSIQDGKRPRSDSRSDARSRSGTDARPVSRSGSGEQPA